MKVLVSGAGGLVGRALCAHLAALGHGVVPAVRRPCGMAAEVVVGDIDGLTDWRMALRGCDAVVHLAARVHMMNTTQPDPLAQYRTTNTEATTRLARQAAAAGVRRFVFVSTVKVHGEGGRRAYRETDTPAPDDAYAISKWEAEQGLERIARETGLAVVVVRPPLVYGPGAKANLLRLMLAVRRGWPLPLGAIDNRRSLVGLDNLVDFIMTCIEHPAAANQTFLVSDGADLSTTELIRHIASAMDRPARLVPVPRWMLVALGSLLGKRALVQRLCGSLQVDISKARNMLGWIPPISVDEGMRRSVPGSR